MEWGFKFGEGTNLGVFPCPSCDREFDTQRGRSVHHTHAHNEALPNRTCPQCGDEFRCHDGRKYCSTKCLKEAAPYAGEANPNFKGKKRESNCDICHQAFEYYPSEKRGRYCPSCVKTETWQTGPGLTGSTHPRWKGGKVTRQCEVCGDDVERWPSEFADVVVCGQSCRAAWLSEAFAGEGHPNWEGGDTGPYGPGWAAIRRNALERDGYACQICGTEKADLGRNPDVHHIVPVRAFIEDEAHSVKDAHTLDNVITLCIRCHRKADVGIVSRSTLKAMIKAKEE